MRAGDGWCVEWPSGNVVEWLRSAAAMAGAPEQANAADRESA